MKKAILKEFYDYVYKEHNCVLREEQIELFLEKYYPAESLFLTTGDLLRLHPEISIAEAFELLEFAEENTITYKTCYGDGSIICPLWKKEKEASQ
jgi:hypothetical protein